MHFCFTFTPAKRSSDHDVDGCIFLSSRVSSSHLTTNLYATQAPPAQKGSRAFKLHHFYARPSTLSCIAVHYQLRSIKKLDRHSLLALCCLHVALRAVLCPPNRAPLRKITPIVDFFFSLSLLQPPLDPFSLLLGSWRFRSGRCAAIFRRFL